MRRRSVLALLGTTLPLTGCLSEESRNTSRSDKTTYTTAQTGTTPSTTTTPPPPKPTISVDIGETVELPGGGSIGLTEVHFRRILFEQTHPDAVSPITSTGSQFVICTIPVDGSEAVVPDPYAFQFVLDDERYRSTTTLAGASITRDLSFTNKVVNPTPSVAAENDLAVASVAFVVPLDADPESVVIEFEREDALVRWMWNDALVKDLAAPPEFTVTSIGHPESFVCDEQFPISMTVANNGGRRGHFAGIVGATAPTEQQHPRPVRLELPPGGRKTWEGELQYPPRVSRQEECEEVESVTVEFDWAIDSRTVTIDRRQK